MFYGKGINDMPRGWYSDSVLNKRIYHCWHRMLGRCYREGVENTSYKDCYVCDRWLTLSNFVQDITSIDGYELWLHDEGIALDKDIKSNGRNKCYCLEQCMFVTVGENSRQATKNLIGRNLPQERKDKISNTLKGKNSGKNHPRAKPIIGVNIEDGSIIKYNFAKESVKDGFSPKHIGSCCNGNRKTHKGYRWYHEEDYLKSNNCV